MRTNRQYRANAVVRQAARQAPKTQISWTQRARRAQLGSRNEQMPFSPPEDWHEPVGDVDGYRIIEQSPGAGYRHVVTPEQIRQRNAWITIQKSHAIANGVPVLFSNRLGREQAESADIVIDFWGSSHIIGPFGEVLAKAPVDQPAVITAGIDPEESRRVRDTWPFLLQRRTDFS